MEPQNVHTLTPEHRHWIGMRMIKTVRAVFLAALLGALIVWFTFFPPMTALFADLSGAVRTFLTIPV